MDPDPFPHQNVMDPQHWLTGRICTQLLPCVPALPLRFAVLTKAHVSTVQADSWAREPVSQLHLDEAARAGHPPLHREARDAPRARLLRQPVRVLQAGQPTRCYFNQCCATGNEENTTFCLGKTRTVMKFDSGSGYGSGSSMKCNAKVKNSKNLR